MKCLKHVCFKANKVIQNVLSYRSGLLPPFASSNFSLRQGSHGGILEEESFGGSLKGGGFLRRKTPVGSHMDGEDSFKVDGFSPSNDC